MKIQYLGLLPLLIISIIAWSKAISFYLKYGTCNYMDERIPTDSDALGWLTFVTIEVGAITMGGIIWALI